MWSIKVSENTITSFKQTNTNSAVDSDYNPTKTCCIKCWNTAGAFVTPDGITLNLNNPLWVMKAVFCWLSAWTLVYQYPDLRCSVVKYLDFPNWSSKSNTLGSGNTLSLVTEAQNLSVPSLFLTNTMGLARGLSDGSIMLFFCISSRCLAISCQAANAILLTLMMTYNFKATYVCH